MLKRTSPSTDWIVRATRDTAIRETVVAGGQIRLAEPLAAPYLGIGSAGESLALGRARVHGPSVGPGMERDPDRLPPRGLDATIGDWDAQLDLTWIVGLLLRGWRKGLDAEAGAVLASGVPATDDLAWWSARAVDAADRRL